MTRLFFIIFTIVAPVLMGSFVVVVLTVPSLAQNDQEYILPAVGAGVAVAIVASFFIAKNLEKATKK